MTLRVYLDAVAQRAEAAKDDLDTSPLVQAAAEEIMLAHARTDLPRLVQGLRLALEVLGDIAIAPCLSELLGEGDQYENTCPGCRSRKALADLDALAKEKE